MVEADDARISDETLIGRTAAGDAAAFGRLVRRCCFLLASLHAFAPLGDESL